MKKRMIGITIGIIIILGLIITFATKQKTIYTEIDGIKYAILVDGQLATEFPSGGYKANINCTNAKGYWDAVEQRVIIREITGLASCFIEFTSITNDDYLNNYIISLENDANQGDGTLVHEVLTSFTTIDNQTTTEAGYRYEGDNPNNYVWFNNELWRIIGVFGPESHGQTGKQLVKIIRDDSIGGLVWNINNTSKWNTSSLKALLNGAYYNHTTDIENCYSYGYSNIKTTCDYTRTGIQSGYQGMIENVIWYLGGGGKSGSTTYTAPMEYKYERTGIVYDSTIVPTTGEGKIGLMYVSDYLYAVKENDCLKSISGSDYSKKNYKDCAGKNWLYAGYDYCTISQDSYYSDELWSISFQGKIEISQADKMRAIRPVLYLSSSVYKISGSGTQVDPYIIGMTSN